MQTDFDKELAEFFTDVEHLREEFKNLLAAPTLLKHLLIIHGVGGVGKSSLLRMFRLHCKNAGIPVAFASGDEAKSAVEVLFFKSQAGEERGWVPDLKADGVHFPKFDATFEDYKAIQAKVDKQVRKAGGRAADIAGKAASKTVEAAGGALAGAAIGSVIPGIGTTIGGVLGGVLGEMGAEALTNWLRGFLKKPEIDLLLDPAKKLTEDFLDDLTKAGGKRRIILMLDTFEQMTTLDDWVRDVAQQLHDANVLFVIAGRAFPNWSRAWLGWEVNAQVEELKPMGEEVMRELVRRYYATMRGGEPEPNQVDAIIRFARGLPIVVTSLVRLWVKYPGSFGDIQIVKPEVMSDLVDRLLEGVPTTLIPALEAAAVVHWFNQPILRAVMRQADVRDVYNELCRFPFARPRADGWALHDAVREIIDENLRIQDFERHCELHERAAVYFEKRLGEDETEEAERLSLERLYHRIRADEKEGILLFQGMAEELTRYRLVNRLRTLLNDMNTYPLERENSKLWREYYIARLADMESRGVLVEQGYESVANNPQVEPKLKAYALCDLGGMLSRWQHLGKSGGITKATHILDECLKLTTLDSHLAYALFSLAHIYQYSGKWDESLECLERARQFYAKRNDNYEMAYTYAQFMVMWLHMGKFGEIYKLEKECNSILSELPRHSYTRAQVMAYACTRVYIGRYAESEKYAEESLTITQDVGDRRSSLEPMRWLSLALALQGKFNEAIVYCNKHKNIVQEMGSYYIKDGGHGSDVYGTILTLQGRHNEAEEQLLLSLTIKGEVKEDLWVPATLVRLGTLYESRLDWKAALDCFQNSIKANTVNHQYFKSEALAGEVRVKCYLEDFSDVTAVAIEADKIAQQNEFNNHLASLRLIQGHLAWDGYIPEWGNGFDAAQHHYKHALIYALRFNRFLLDEVLSGRPQGTPLRPIIPYCLEQGEEGKQMLTALLDWWKTGFNDTGTPRPDTISPIPEGIPLLEAERIAREREPGDGSPQTSVVEQIEAALSKLGA